MFIDKALGDHSAEVARKILARGLKNVEALLSHTGNDPRFLYVACPDFSISLRQRRLKIGLPIGGYVNWGDSNIFPLELDVNSCGVHLLKLPPSFDEDSFRRRLETLHGMMDRKEFHAQSKALKWNFSRRNHFINLYEDEGGRKYLVFHSAGETALFDWDYLHSQFDVKSLNINGRAVPYISGPDVERYWSIAETENAFFLERHKHVFQFLFGDDYEVVFADQHFGMMRKGEILMGCSKIRVGDMFPLLTRPFEKVFLARAEEPGREILAATDGYALVPHGLGMTIPDGVIDIIPDSEGRHSVVAVHENGSRMITETLEYLGIGYRGIDVVPEMAKRGDFTVVGELKPILCLKL